MTAPVLSRSLAVSDIHGHVDLTLVPDERQRAALAAEYGLLEVPAFAATLTLTADAGGAVDVTGRVVADLVQPCVVTLAPVAQHIDEPFAVRFVRPGSPEDMVHGPGAEIVVDAAAPDPPELLTGSTIDVGPLVEEAFVLAIDPYPRAPDAALPPEAVDPGDAATDSPFAILAGLKQPRR